MIDFFIVLICCAISLAFLRFIRGKTLSNRVVAFDVMSLMVVCLLVILSISYKSSLYLDVAFVFALIGFLGVIIFARFNVLFKDTKEVTDA